MRGSPPGSSLNQGGMEASSAQGLHERFPQVRWGHSVPVGWHKHTVPTVPSGTPLSRSERVRVGVLRNRRIKVTVTKAGLTENSQDDKKDFLVTTLHRKP